MNKFKKLFVVLEANSSKQPALERAIQIAEINQASIRLCLGANSRRQHIESDTDKENSPQSEEAFKQKLTANCESFLSQFIDYLQNKSISADFNIGWEEDAVTGIIKAAEDFEADVVIKSSHHHGKFKTLFYNPTDWKLLRQCSIPILMVHLEKPDIPKNILAAVSAMVIDEEHGQLDLKILEYASSINRLFQSNLKVINAFAPVPLGVSLDGTGVYQDEYLIDLQQEHHKKTLSLTRKFSINDSDVETINSDINHAIASSVASQHSDLVILGTIAREGLSALFVGNTAEKIIEKLDCDILTVKYGV